MLYESSKASAVRDCECIGCFDVAYGYINELCWACHEANCAEHADCQREDIYEEC